MGVSSVFLWYFDQMTTMKNRIQDQECFEQKFLFFFIHFFDAHMLVCRWSANCGKRSRWWRLNPGWDFPGSRPRALPLADCGWRWTKASWNDLHRCGFPFFFSWSFQRKGEFKSVFVTAPHYVTPQSLTRAQQKSRKHHIKMRGLVEGWAPPKLSLNVSREAWRCWDLIRVWWTVAGGGGRVCAEIKTRPFSHHLSLNFALFFLAFLPFLIFADHACVAEQVEIISVAVKLKKKKEISERKENRRKMSLFCDS